LPNISEKQSLSLREEQGGGDVLAARHGCETGNPFYTVPFDFANLIHIKPQAAIAQHEISLVKKEDYFNFSLLTGKMPNIAREHLFPMSLCWGVHVMPPDDPVADFTQNAAKPAWVGQTGEMPTTGAKWLERILDQHLAELLALFTNASNEEPEAPLAPRESRIFVRSAKQPGADTPAPRNPGAALAKALINFAAKLLYYKGSFSVLGKQLETYLAAYDKEHDDHKMDKSMKVFYDQRNELLGAMCSFLNQQMQKVSEMIRILQDKPEHNPVLIKKPQGGYADDTENRNGKLTFLKTLMDAEIPLNPYPKTHS
jgi:hypothetical protein